MESITGKRTTWGAAVVVVWMISGCYGDIRDYCETTTSCLGGNANDEDACVETQKGMRKMAKAYDCKDQFDKAMECYADEVACEEGQIVMESEKCLDLAEKYLACEDKNSDW